MRDGESTAQAKAPSAAGGSSLRGPVLGLLLEQERPIPAYRLSGLLMQRLPEWQVRHSNVANLLKRLAVEGYAESSDGATTRYQATEKARIAVEEWMRQPLPRQTLREEIHARIASASPHHAALLYQAVDAYEQECFALLDENEPTWEPGAATGSWRSLTINLTRSAADETLRGHITWSKLAKQALKDWLAAHGAMRPPRGSDPLLGTAPLQAADR